MGSTSKGDGLLSTDVSTSLGVEVDARPTTPPGILILPAAEADLLSGVSGVLACDILRGPNLCRSEDAARAALPRHGVLRPALLGRLQQGPAIGGALLIC